MSFPIHRHRRLRRSGFIRDLVAETQLSVDNLIAPLFVIEGQGAKEEIDAMPGYYRFSLDNLLKEVEECRLLGIKGFLLFAKINPSEKDNQGKGALNPKGLLPRAISELKRVFPEAVLFSDVAMDPYSSYGHDGIVEGDQVVNDPTLRVLAEMAKVHADCGVDFVAPSDMMDGRIGTIRHALDTTGYTNTGILSYAAKYASAFYGPFRDALDSAPGFGDKSGYQMDVRNAREAIKECQSDVDEGADILMIKPALPYLDIIREASQKFNLPVAAYQVSGEYSMIKYAAKAGCLQESKAILESLYAIKRSGASLIASYFAKSAARLIGSQRIH